MFLLRSGLRFSFRPLEVPEPRVRKRPLSLTNRAFSFIFLKKCFSGTPYCISALENSGADFDNGSKSLCCLNILPIVLDSSLYEAGDLLIMIDTLRYEL